MITSHFLIFLSSLSKHTNEEELEDTINWLAKMKRQAMASMRSIPRSADILEGLMVNEDSCYSAGIPGRTRVSQLKTKSFEFRSTLCLILQEPVRSCVLQIPNLRLMEWLVKTPWPVVCFLNPLLPVFTHCPFFSSFVFHHSSFEMSYSSAQILCFLIPFRPVSSRTSHDNLLLLTNSKLLKFEMG